MPERLIGAVLKTAGPAKGPGVRIPLPPPFSPHSNKLPRLTVELVVVSAEGVLLTRRQIGACQGLWQIPGGTVRFCEPLNAAVHRGAEQELAIEVIVDGLLGYIEHPSHLERGLDGPVGLAFGVHLTSSSAGHFRTTPDAVAWFAHFPTRCMTSNGAF